MVKLRLRYVVEDTDRHGNVRLYFRRKGQRKIRLKGLVGSDEFMKAYDSALSGQLLPATRSNLRKLAERGTFRWLCEEYFKSAEFKFLDERTRRKRRVALDKICALHGSKPANKIEPRHVRALRDERSDRPEAANEILKTLRQLLSFAVEIDLIKHNPAKEVPYIRHATDGFHSWTIAEVRQFEDRHPVGSQARLALALLLYTAQRKSDVIRLGRQHIRVLADGRHVLEFTQHKNRARTRVQMQIPVMPELWNVIEATSTGKLQFIVTQFGKPFTANGFGNKFRQWCDEAKLPQCSSHGLRKATATRMAELGCSEHEIMAVTGHRTSKEVGRYTRAASQKRLADSAMAKFQQGLNENRSVPLSEANADGGTLLGSIPLKSQS